MKRSSEEDSERWLQQALHDLDDAKFVLGGGRYNLACFLAQQAAEKFIKAFLYGKGAPDIRGHSVRDLCMEAAKLGTHLSDLCKRWRVLDKYYIPTRYPNGLPGGIPSEAFDENDGLRAISIAEDIATEIQGRLRE